ncbi:hypothetical protein VIGAN_05241600 [Vigna angularis var. angularis]|uniref:FAR1 domain-containing protein n=1 Tax=Vigna angularis var. angularis TaxID=157739 RepID=A0A0S3S7K9_PHAAN|nr:hypothetical protein VIGAN_05241600 [Vigna angularis var. angularis]
MANYLNLDNVEDEIVQELNIVDDSCLNLEPSLHMSFDTMEEAKKFYEQYKMRCGFGVRTRTSKKNDKNEVYYFRLVCSREGKYVSSIRPKVKILPNQKKQCPTGITIARKNEKWIIWTVVLQHSHDLCPKRSNLIRANRKLNMHAKHTLEVNDDAGVRINKSFLSIVGKSGGFENMQFVERDLVMFVLRHHILNEQVRHVFCTLRRSKPSWTIHPTWMGTFPNTRGFPNNEQVDGVTLNVGTHPPSTDQRSRTVQGGPPTMCGEPRDHSGGARSDFVYRNDYFP